jgi:predicted deacylase
MTNRTIEVGNVVARPGTFKAGFLKGIDLPMGYTLDLPLMVLNGEKPGPTFFIQVGIHGVENTGIPMCRRVMREKLTPKDLSGAIVAIPGANPMGYMLGTSWNPLDWQDPSPNVPGNPKGFASARTGAIIWEAVEKVKPDFAMDSHCNPFTYPLTLSTIMASERYAMDNETAKKIVSMGESAGLTLIRSHQPPGDLPPPRGFSNNCKVRGIPCLGSEFGWGFFPHGPEVEAAAKAFTNILKHLNMVKGEPEKITEVPVKMPPPTFLHGHPMIAQCDRGGYMEPTQKAGDVLEEGTKIANIYTPVGDLVEEIKMPYKGGVYSYHTGRWHWGFALHSGSRVAWLFGVED